MPDEALSQGPGEQPRVILSGLDNVPCCHLQVSARRILPDEVRGAHWLQNHDKSGSNQFTQNGFAASLRSVFVDFEIRQTRVNNLPLNRLFRRRLHIRFEVLPHLAAALQHLGVVISTTKDNHVFGSPRNVKLPFKRKPRSPVWSQPSTTLLCVSPRYPRIRMGQQPKVTLHLFTRRALGGANRDLKPRRGRPTHWVPPWAHPCF